MSDQEYQEFQKKVEEINKIREENTQLHAVNARLVESLAITVEALEILAGVSNALPATLYLAKNALKGKVN